MKELDPVRDSLYHYARRAALRPDTADDLVQNAALLAWREFAKFRAGSNFRAWIFRILVNTVWQENKRHARSYRREETTATVDLVAAAQHEDAWLALILDRGRLAELLDQRLAAALDSLDPPARECLLMRLLEEFSYREIAGIVGLPAGTVMSHVHRGRIALRERLAQVAVEHRLHEKQQP